MRLIEVTLAQTRRRSFRTLTLDELRLPDSVRVVAVVRNEQPLVPSSPMHFLENDHVILIARGDANQECATAFIA
jgi:Trk K+ transport system NAD-binding subunit